MQGYNAQAVVTEQQIMIAAEVTIDSPDFGHLEPMVDAALRELERAGVTERPRTVLADAGYWHTKQIERLARRRDPGADPARREQTQGRPPGLGGRVYAFMRRVLATELGRELYGKRTTQHRAGLRADQVQPPDRPLPTTRQGRVRSEWRLIAATHNLLKLHNHWIAKTA